MRKAIIGILGILVSVIVISIMIYNDTVYKHKEIVTGTSLFNSVDGNILYIPLNFEYTHQSNWLYNKNPERIDGMVMLHIRTYIIEKITMDSMQSNIEIESIIKSIKIPNMKYYSSIEQDSMVCSDIKILTVGNIYQY